MSAVEESSPSSAPVEKKQKAPAKRTTTKKKVDEEEVENVGVESKIDEPNDEKPKVRKATTRGKKSAVKVVETEVEVDGENAEEEKTEKKKSSKSKKSSAENASTNPSPLSGNGVARCFGNIVSSADVMIELERLKSLHQANASQTESDLQICVNRILTQYKTTTQISLCNELIQQFVSLQDPVYKTKFLFQLADNLRVKDKAVRLRSANLIKTWLRAQTEVAEDVHTRLTDGLLEATVDKNPLVRQEAVSCLEFLQDPNNKEDRVIKALCSLAEHDSVAKVRKTVLRVVSPTERSIRMFAGRTRDESDEVRQTAWKEMEERFKMSWFDSDLLVEMFDQGLEDFAPSVKSISHKTLTKWFKEEKHQDVSALLQHFDVEANEELATRILDVVSSTVREKISDISPAASLSKEASLWLRYICEKKFEESEITATALMDALGQILQVIKHSRENLENYYSCSFVAKQLALASSHLNLLQDPFGKANVLRVLSEALLVEDFPSFVVDSMVKALRNCFASPSEDSQFVLDVTTNILGFLSELSPLDQVRADIMKAEQLIDDYTRAKNYASLPGLVSEIEALKQKEQALIHEQEQGGEAIPTFSRLVRSSALVCALLKSIPRNFKDSLISSLMDTICVPAIQSPEVEARAYGVEALGLLALRELEIAKSHGILLAKTFFDNEREELAVRLRALQVLFDLVTVFGKDVATDAAEFDLLVQYLMGLLEVDRDPEIRFVAAHGLTRLLFLGRVAYPGLVQCLLIVLFHPSSETNPKLKQCLTTFFAEYHQTRVVLQAAEPLIDAMINPSKDSMCEDLPIEKVLERLVFLLRSVEGKDKASRVENEEGDVQLDFALMLTNKIASHGDDSYHLKLLVKTLTSVNLSSSVTNLNAAREEKLRRLRYWVELVQRYFGDSDKVALKQIEKFGVVLEKLDSTSDIELSEAIKNEIAQTFTRKFGSSDTVAVSRPKRATAAKSKAPKEEEGDASEDDSVSESDDE